MRDMPSKFIEILDPSDNLRFSDSDVRLEDVLADHEAIVTRPRSATKITLEETEHDLNHPATTFHIVIAILRPQNRVLG
ncbi:hypothetical protein KXX54_006866 [Aspergillus fumigatus]|nr:hypothetical protein KXX54_006866 [Aspergillus fumigatus]